jgi:hypothetical protein
MKPEQIAEEIAQYIEGHTFQEIRDKVIEALTEAEERSYHKGVEDFRRLVHPQDYEWDGGAETWNKHLLVRKSPTSPTAQ